MSSWDQANRGGKHGLVWRNRRKKLPNYQWLPLLTVLPFKYFMVQSLESSNVFNFGKLKGTGSRDRIQIFWKKCMALGLNYPRD